MKITKDLLQIIEIFKILQSLQIYVEFTKTFNNKKSVMNIY